MSEFRTALNKYIDQSLDRDKEPLDLIILNHIDISLNGVKPNFENIRKILKEFGAIEYYDRIGEIFDILYRKWLRENKNTEAMDNFKNNKVYEEEWLKVYKSIPEILINDSIQASSLRKNMYIFIDQIICKIVDITTSKGGRIKMNIVGLGCDDKKHSLLIWSTETIKVPSKILVYGDSTCSDLKVNGHVESNLGQTVFNMVEYDNQDIGLEMVLKEDTYSHLIFFG